MKLIIHNRNGFPAGTVNVNGLMGAGVRRLNYCTNMFA